MTGKIKQPYKQKTPKSWLNLILVKLRYGNYNFCCTHTCTFSSWILPKTETTSKLNTIIMRDNFTRSMLTSDVLRFSFFPLTGISCIVALASTFRVPSVRPTRLRATTETEVRTLWQIVHPLSLDQEVRWINIDRNSTSGSVDSYSVLVYYVRRSFPDIRAIVQVSSLHELTSPFTP